jgi:purine-binding chemotaxis protein CheW
MASHNSNDFSSPQEAIEGYLEALLEDVADYDESEEELTQEESPFASADVVAAANPITEEPIAEVVTPVIEESQPDPVQTEPVIASEPEMLTRVFAPSGEEQYSVQPKTQTSSDFERPVEVAYQEAPSVVMPELQIAEEVIEPVVETITETVTETFVATPEPEHKVAEPVIEFEVAEPVVDVQVEAEISEPEVAFVEPEVATEEALLEQVMLDEPVVDVRIEENIETEIEEEVKLQPRDNEGWTEGRPNWAQERFECLLFVVKGLKLAVPLAELGGIHKQEKEPTPLFGQPGWFLGILRNNRMNIGLVDTAQWVMPEYINGDHNTDYRFAIHIHNSEWGLACDEVAEAISLDPSEVKWRTKLGRRPWLAGTVVDHMCALIDVAAFARLLDSDKVPVDLQALDAEDEE